jgi:hypothetical protein
MTEPVRQFWYLGAIAAAIGFKAVLVSDLSLVFLFSPHDDSLYVGRAFALLEGHALGAYDSHTLSKLPGISLWLAGMRFIGLPHLLAVNALYVLAGLYMLGAMRRAGAGRALCATVFVLYVLSPITLSATWHRPMREPVGTSLFVIMLAAMAHVFVTGNARKVVWPHVLALSVVFAFSLILREDDKLLWVALGLFAIVLVRKAPLRRVAAAVFVPAVLAIGVGFALRGFVEDRYGLAMLNDFSEGEFPRLMAAIRSVDSRKDNRLVMAPQETLQRLRVLMPEFAPVVERLPPPGPETFSCRLQGVCSEWSNGWMPWWIKDAAAAAGRTPDLPSAQRYFGDVRMGIEAACQRGELKCTNKGSGLIPPFELRWTAAYFREALRLLAMTSSPKVDVMDAAGSLHDAPPELTAIYRAVTMSGSAGSGASASTKRGTDENRLFDARRALSRLAGACATLLMAAGLVAFLARWALYPNMPTGPAYWIAALFYAFAGFRILVLAYVATFLGPFDPRIVFALYTGALLLSPFVLADFLRTVREARPKTQ